MTYPTKKYIELDSFTQHDRDEDCVVGRYLDESVVELPDFTAMTDMQKLEWVLQEIGAGCYIHDSAEGGKTLHPYGMSSGYYDEKQYEFTKYGKLNT